MRVKELLSSTQFALERLPHYVRLKTLPDELFPPAVVVNFETEDFQVKTLTLTSELKDVLKLRYEVFINEFSGKKIKFPLLRYDVDGHDFFCDHLVVIDKKINKIIACYRLYLCETEKYFNQFYSEDEFNIDEFLGLAGIKLELGRACVHRKYRSGLVISLLWKGVCQYAKASGAKYLFGCTSVKKIEFDNLPYILAYLEKMNCYIEDFHIGVRQDYDLEAHPQVNLKVIPIDSSRKSLNSIFAMYLMAGGKVGRDFAYDAEMDCIDFFTVVNFNQLPASFERRFAC